MPMPVLQSKVTYKDGKVKVFTHAMGGMPEGADLHQVLSDHIADNNLFPGAASIEVSDPDPSVFRPSGLSAAVKAVPKKTPVPTIRRREEGETPRPTVKPAAGTIESVQAQRVQATVDEYHEPASEESQAAAAVQEAGGEVSGPSA